MIKSNDLVIFFSSIRQPDHLEVHVSLYFLNGSSIFAFKKMFFRMLHTIEILILLSLECVQCIELAAELTLWDIGLIYVVMYLSLIHISEPTRPY